MNRKRAFFRNAALLTVGSVVLRFTGLWFRAYITGRIGASGMGLYQLIFSIFALGITACTSGIGLAVTRLVAEGRGSKSCVLSCLRLALSLSFLAAGVLFFGADFAAERFIGTTAAAVPLKLLAPGLPFLAACACLKGYFFANRNTLVPVLGEFWEQAVTIGVSILLLSYAPLPPLDALMLASTLGEIASLIYIVPAFLLYVRRSGLPCRNGEGTMQSVVHIAAPMLAGSFLRSALFSAENVLIPVGLKKYGAGGADALAQYGVMQGMVMPILFFPMSFISSVAMLLIPEIAEDSACGKRESVERNAERAFRFTLMFGFLTSAVFLVFAEELGSAFFGDAQASNILRIMAPIAPLMYLDNVVDNMLKGLDQQMYSLKYNFSDSCIRVFLIWLLLPMFGIRAYIAVLFFSEIYNASLSINRLLKTARLKVDIIGWILFPAVSGCLLYYLLAALKKALGFFI